MLFVTNLNTTDCCQTITNEKLIYFPTTSSKLQNHLGSSKIWSLKSALALLGKMHALLQGVLTIIIKDNKLVTSQQGNRLTLYKESTMKESGITQLI